MRDKRTSRLLYWTPRILAILFLVFLAIFSLDIFDMKLGFWGTILGLFMHNLPVFVLLIVLIISWTYEIVGGIGFIFAGILYIIGLIIRMSMAEFRGYGFLWSLTIAGPAILIGVLFLICWKKKKRRRR